MIKITKAQAKKRYVLGEMVFMNPSKIKLNNPWTAPFGIVASPLDEEDKKKCDFDKLVNNYQYYNCSVDTGKTVHFYKK